MRTLRRLAVPSLLVVVGVFAATASAHTLKIPRAANANKANSKSFCASIVNDPNLGTCVAEKAGPCRRLSEHCVRCGQEQKMELLDGSQLACGIEVDWYYQGRLSVLHARLVESATDCALIRGPTTPLPVG